MEDWAEVRRLHRAERLSIKAIARRLGVAEIPRHLDHRPSGLDKVEHPTTELRRIATPSHADLLNSSSTRIQLRNSTKPGEDHSDP